MNWSIWFNRVTNAVAEQLAGWGWVEWCVAGAMLAALTGAFTVTVLEVIAGKPRRGCDHG